jgi:hypothetical protein
MIPSADADAILEPTLCQSAEHWPEGAEWRYELKLDGYRAIGRQSGRSGEQLWSRNQKEFTRRFPQVVKATAQLPNYSIVDGEVVAFDEQGKSSFNLLQLATPLSLSVRSIYKAGVMDGLQDSGTRSSKASLYTKATNPERLETSFLPSTLFGQIVQWRNRFLGAAAVNSSEWGINASQGPEGVHP